MKARHLPLVVLTVVMLSGTRTASAVVPDAGTTSALQWLEAADPEGAAASRNVYLVRLSGPTTGEILRSQGWKATADPGAAPSAARESQVDAAEASVAEMQAPARAHIESVGARILSTYDAALNGFLVYAEGASVDGLNRTPGIASVGPAPYFELLVEDIVPQMGALEVAQNLGYTGENVTIAIIDTGIDYTHKNLGGTGRSQDYDRARLNPVRSEGLFPNDRVVGGYDFAGTNYTGGANASPDEDPLDENGHGSHVAGIAAGADGNRNLSHGVAKDASLLALKVFGRGGGTNIAQDAVEWAIEVNQRGRAPDGQGSCRLTPCSVDVINMSLGAPFGLLLSGYGDVFENATAAGIVVIASAGNDGDVAWITGAPAVDPKVLSVASAWPQGEIGDVVKVYYDNGAGAVEESHEAVEALADLAPQIAGSPDIRGRLGWFGRGCTGDRQEGDVTGRIALIQRGGCVFKEKLDGAAAAGATAALVFSNGNEITPMGTDGGATSIVAFMIDTVPGEALRELIVEGVAVEVAFSKAWKGTFPRDYLTDTISGFSSRGPGRNGVFKPNIAGLGSQVNAPLLGSGDRGIKLNGTSMSGPSVAGAAAVLIESLRDRGLAAEGALTGETGLSAIDVGVLLVNGAHKGVWNGDSRLAEPVAFARAGAGRSDLSVTTRLETVVRAGTRRPDSPGTPFGIDFGFPQFDDVFVDGRPFFVRNQATETRAYSVTVEFPAADDAESGVRFTPSEAEFTLGPGEIKDLTLNLRADPAAMKPYAAYGGDRAGVSRGLTDAEHDAYVVVREVDEAGAPVPGGDEARLPVYVLPRAASVLAFDPYPLIVTPDGEPTTEQALNTGGPLGVIDLFVPIGEDGSDPGLDDVIDIDYVGARIVTDDAGERVIEVLVHNKGPRVSPMDTETLVGIDTDRNGSIDYVAIAQDVALWPPPDCGNPNAGFSGVIGVVLSRVPTQNPFAWSCTGSVRYLAGVDVNSRATVLPMLASDLGYQPNERIAFDVIVRHRESLPGTVAATSLTIDMAPNDAMVGQGVGPGRMNFDPEGAGVVPSQWRIEVPGQGTAEFPLSRLPDAPLGSLLAHYSTNLVEQDIALVPIEEGVVWSHVIHLPVTLKKSALSSN